MLPVFAPDSSGKLAALGRYFFLELAKRPKELLPSLRKKTSQQAPCNA